MTKLTVPVWAFTLVIATLTAVADLSAVATLAAEAPSQSQPADVSFNNQIMPLFGKLGCNATACHGSQGGRGSFKLSMFGADSEDDYAATSKAAEGRRINTVEPLKSLLLQKVTNQIKHGGGERIKADSPEYKMLAGWIAQGAPPSPEDEPSVVLIEVAPPEQILAASQTKQLSVTAVFSDGTRKDVTADALYSANRESIAAVDAGGKVAAAGYGESIVLVTYMRRFATSRIMIPQILSEPFPEIKPYNKIDELVLANQKKLGILPSEVSSDHEFLRRVYLDVTGTLPTAEAARAFLADADPLKRSKLIDRLLAGQPFADYWAMKWGDLLRMKSEYPNNLWPNAVQAYHRWVRHGIVQNKPYDQFARELLTASGSNFRVPEANYYRAYLRKEPRAFGEVSALIFMGARVGCAHCHAHPTAPWELDDNLGLSAFFSQVRFKATREWKEEIVYINPNQTLRHPRTKQVVQPKILGGDLVELAPGEDARIKFADWLVTPQNPWFSKAIVNRVWFWLLGQGIVHEPDDMRPTNPPENPALLAYLEKELIEHNFDLKHIYRLILNSRTYQLSAKSNPSNAHDTVHFSHYLTKRLGAETLLDTISDITGTWDSYFSSIPEPFVRLPKEYRATHLADGSIGIPFLELFGRPPRDTAFESDRDSEASMRQVLYLLNSSHVQGKINASPRLKKLLAEVADDPQVVEELFLLALSRPPTDQERNGTLDYFWGTAKAAHDQAQAERKAAEQSLAKVRADLGTAKAGYDAAEKAAKAAEAAAARAKAARPKAVAAHAAAQKAATTKRQEADQAKKKLVESTEKEQKPTEAQVSAALKAVTDAGAAKTGADAALATAEQNFTAVDKAATDAEAAAKAIDEDPAKSDDEKNEAAAEAAAKRKLADAAKAALAQATQKQEELQSQAAEAAGGLTAANAAKTTAEEALAKIKGRVATAATARATAEKAATDAAAATAAAKTALDAATAAQTTTQNDAAAKRKTANEAKAQRDKLTALEKTAAAKPAEADKKIAAALAAKLKRRPQALQDLVWALLNTKEYMFNH